MAAPKPNLLERAIARVAPRYALERAIAQDKLTLFGYDAAHPGIARGGSGGMGKNAGSETSKMAMDRLSVMWDARDLERNMPVIRCVLDRTSQYVCGVIQYQAQTGDDQADSAYESYWQNWCETVADVTGRHNFRMLVELAFRSMLRDGDFGFYLVRNGPLLQLQCIESDRIGDPNKVSNQLDDALVQGIQLNPLGQPVGYDIYNRERKSNRYSYDKTAPADQFLFLSKPLRTDEYRGVSWLAPVIAQARDLYEMFSFERGAAKWAASIAGVIRVTDTLSRNSTSAQAAWDGQTAAGENTMNVTPNRLLRLKPNEDVTPFNTGNRPSGAFAAYIDAALRDIDMGLNVPFGFFNMAQFGGATVRLEAMQLQRTFARYQEILESKVLTKIKNAVLNNAIALGELPATQNWTAGRWQFGPHLTADTGYDTDANVVLLQNGLKSAASIAGEEGYDYEDLVNQLIKEATILRDRCGAAGIPVEMVAMGRFPAATQQLAAVNDAATPKPAPTIDEMGDGGVKSLVDILEKAAQGVIPREEAVALLVSVYQFEPAAAAAIVPDKQAGAVKANQPAPKAAPNAGAVKPARKPSER
jgi:lambda family phage portal protein